MKDLTGVMIEKEPTRGDAKLFLEDAIVNKVCLMGQLELCCRYLCLGQSGYACAKLEPILKTQIDGAKDAFIAQGDNCDGIQMLNATVISRN